MCDNFYNFYTLFTASSANLRQNSLWESPLRLLLDNFCSSSGILTQIYLSKGFRAYFETTFTLFTAPSVKLKQMEWDLDDLKAEKFATHRTRNCPHKIPQSFCDGNKKEAIFFSSNHTSSHVRMSS